MAKIGKSARTKGQVGEREWRDVCIANGFVNAKRTIQSQGGACTGSDVACEGLPIHFEVKRTEGLRLWEAIDQCNRDAKDGHLPVVVHRPSRRPWICILTADNFFELLRMAGLAPDLEDSLKKDLTS